jgi:hypothetical protein
MKPPTFRGKPSDDHVIWRRKGGAAKRFDEDRLREWCARRHIDFETAKRVDHERSERPRDQYRVVFAWSDTEGESFDLGDEQWQIETGETPRTFLEIDSEGEARLKSWSSERILDIEELQVDGDALVFDAAEFDGRKRLDAAKLTARPE